MPCRNCNALWSGFQGLTEHEDMAASALHRLWRSAAGLPWPCQSSSYSKSVLGLPARGVPLRLWVYIYGEGDQHVSAYMHKVSVCMWVCVYVYVSVRVYVCVWVGGSVRVCACMRLCTCTCILCMCIHTRISGSGTCLIYQWLFSLRCVGCSHNCSAVFLANPTQIRQWLHDCNVWCQLSPQWAKGGVRCSS